MASGELEVDPDVAFGMQVLPGNEYPRKHTLFLNFNGGMLYSGADNSAENRSTLAKQGVYPAYEGGAQKAMAIIQAVQEDVAPYGIIVAFEERPPSVVPYTMEMVGGFWQDTNISAPAAGVAPGSDCGALGQRHVVYTFAGGGVSATQAANTVSQEAGHAWGLDHTFNCDSVMSYCGLGDGGFASTCDALCEEMCQGINSAGCRLTHELFCGEDNDQQNEDAELTYLFGGNEPDIEPPVVEILEPEDGLEVEEGADVDVRSLVSDDYGGYGWYYVITHNGMEAANFVDFDRQVDADYRPAINLTQLPPGVWEITVGTQDHFGHTAQDTVTVYVEAAAGSSGEDTGADTDGSAIDDTHDDEGCACRSGAPQGAGWALWGLWGLVGLRRRRPRIVRDLAPRGREERGAGTRTLRKSAEA
ncbi:MAG: hypothetical protein KDK70_16835 [Myxococcales bacterium]|nr:hypothetical protein [Myxococcales bacterium]